MNFICMFLALQGPPGEPPVIPPELLAAGEKGPGRVKRDQNTDPKYEVKMAKAI